MTNWHESPLIIVKSADPTKHDGASLKKMLAELESLIASGGYVLKSVTECNGQIFVFLINESELDRFKTRTTTTASSDS
ncbi:MAG: hypothetical protein WBP64_02405 [Nitrososphaeraceae archaeon]|jgi:hypothetical protein